MKNNEVPQITVFHCINTFEDDADLSGLEDLAAGVKFIKMACSSMVKDVYLLRALEAGADAVLVVVCPDGRCRYVEGNLRAKKRIDRVRGLLEDIGLDGRRLSLLQAARDDDSAVLAGLQSTLAALQTSQPKPAA